MQPDSVSNSNPHPCPPTRFIRVKTFEDFVTKDLCINNIVPFLILLF